LNARRFVPALVLVLAACATTSTPAPAPGDPVETIANGFRAGQDGLAYAMVYDLREPFDVEVRAVAEFENPSPAEPPLRVEQAIPAGARRIALNSPLMHEIRNHRDYAVVLTVYKDGAPVLTYRDRARFDVDESIVPMFIRRGIEVR
jgi:hypothetical protein